MEEIKDLLDSARNQAETFLNVGQRNWGHVALGVVLAAGFTVSVTYLAKDVVPDRRARPALSTAKRPMKLGNLILPAVFSSNTVSALRVWNAPAGQRRLLAMGLWAASQAANAWWLAARPTRLWPQIGAAMASSGLATAFAYEAQRLNPTASMRRKAGRPVSGKPAQR